MCVGLDRGCFPQSLVVRSFSNKDSAIDGEVLSSSSSTASSTATAPSSGEQVTGKFEKKGFQAETLKLLDIVTHSLYSEREVFVRELISNASDALEKVRQLQMVGKSVKEEGDADGEGLQVKIWADEEKRTLVIEDFGCGMSKEELVDNLGTIARSGTQSFIESMKSSGKTDMQNIIGQFGVGFYSVFMVADSVTVFSQSYDASSPPYVWKSDGSGTYEIAQCEGVHRGTKIIINLKESCAQFSHASAIRDIIKKYSNFVQFPILVNGERVNTVEAIWTLSKDKVTDEMHKQFYQFISHQRDTPSVKFMYATDSPINIRSVFYVGRQHMEKFGMKKMDPGVSLFSRRVLIQPKAEGLLPSWLRFVYGVVDSEDVPLSVSREHLQDQRIIQRINGVVTKRVLKEFKDLMKADNKAYDKFFEEFGIFLKEGVCTDMRYKDDLAGLLRFDSSHSPEELVSLDTYFDRMKPKQEEIYYLHVANRQMGETSPYYEAFKKKGLEVLFVYSLADEVVLQNVVDYRSKRVVSVESAHVDLSSFPDDPAYKAKEEETKSEESSSSAGKLSEQQVKDLCKWLKEEALLGRVSEVKPSDRLVETPVLIADYEGAQMRRMMKYVDPQGAKSMQLPPQKLQINPKHKLIVRLGNLYQTSPELASLTAEQLLDNALVTAGLMDDSRSMLPRITKILEEMVKAKN